MSMFLEGRDFLAGIPDSSATLETWNACNGNNGLAGHLLQDIKGEIGKEKVMDDEQKVRGTTAKHPDDVDTYLC